MRHANPILTLDELPLSTRYYWQGKIEKLYTLNVWAGWRKARLSGAETPTIDGIWGTAGFTALIFVNERTSEVVVAKESPGHAWRNYGEFMPTSRESTQKLLAGVNMTGLAVDAVLKEYLSLDMRKKLLHFLPVCGKYQGEFWSDEQAVTGVLSDTHSLRDIQSHQTAPGDIDILRRISAILQSRTIKAAISVLEQKAPIVPKEARPQLELDLIG